MSGDVHGEVRVTSRSQESLSVESQGVCFMRISCVPSRQPHACELHRKLCVYEMSKNIEVYCTLLYTQ